MITIEDAKVIIKSRLFVTTNDNNALLGGRDLLEKVAAGNRAALSPYQRQKKIENLRAKIKHLVNKGCLRAKQMQSIRLNTSLDSIHHKIALLEHQIEMLLQSEP